MLATPKKKKPHDLQCWPRAAIAARNVLKVANDKGMGVGVVALDSDAVTAGRTVGIKRCDIVHAHVNLVVDDFVEAFGLSLAF